MSQKLRQDQILQILEKTGYVTVRYLVETLQYSSATINRDLNAMQLAGLVKRSYGGVETVKNRHLPPLSQRQFYRKKEKRRIAEAAAELIKSGDTVFLNGGTTVQYMVPFLLEKKGITVITNSLRIAIELGDTENDVICLGGHVKERPHVLYGEETIENAMKFLPDKMFFSVGGVTADGYIDGANLLHTILLKNSAEVYFLTDRSKLSDRLQSVLCDFSVLTGVISDFDFTEETKARYPKVRFLNAEELRMEEAR